MRSLRLSLVAILVLITSTSYALGQKSPANRLSGPFPEARFDGSFQKYLSHDVFSPFFSWRGIMGIDIATYREGNHTIYFKSEFQTVGARKTDSKINVSGTSYILEGRYRYQLSENTFISTGITHLSSHLTQDLEKIIRDQRNEGAFIPQIDASDLNVIFVEGYKKFSALPLEPEIRLRVQPVGFRFRGGGYNYERPVYLATKFTPWRGDEKRIAIATQHEFGEDYFNDFSVSLELFSRGDEEGRVQLFLAGSPGDNLHVSPNAGWHRDGIRTGIKLVFWSH